MAKNKTSKHEEVATMADAFAGAKGVVFANFAGLTVKASTALRAQCRAANVKYIVVKKTLLNLALKQAGVNVVDVKALTGGVSVVIGYEDEIAAAKLLRDFAKENSQVEFVGGLIPTETSWQYMDKAQITTLASLPTKQQLTGQVVGLMASPLRGFVSVLSGNVRGLVQVLNALATKI